MLLLHEVHTVAGKHEDEFEAAFRDGWMPKVAADDDAPALLPPARARNRSGVPHGHDHGAARRRGLRATGDARATRRPSQLGGRSRPPPPRGGSGKLLLPGRLVTDGRPRPHHGSDRRPRARRGALHGRQRVAARGVARPLPRKGPNALRAQLGATDGALAADAPRRVPSPRRAAPGCTTRVRRREVVLWLSGSHAGAREAAMGFRCCSRRDRQEPTRSSRRTVKAGGEPDGTWMHDALEVRDDCARAWLLEANGHEPANHPVEHGSRRGGRNALTGADRPLR